MRDLIKFAEIVNKQKVKNIEVIGNPNGSPTKLNKLYEGIISGKYKNDKEAAADLYDSDESNPSFKKLKYRLEERLINSIFFIDVNKPNYREIEKEYFAGHKIYAAIKILRVKGGRSIAIKLSERLLPQMIKFEFLDIVCSLAEYLYLFYGSISSNKKKMDYYSAIHKKYLKIYNAESIATRYYSQLAYYNTEGITIPDNFEELADSYCQELEELLKTNDSRKFLRIAYTVFWLRYILVNDYQKGLEVCQELLKKIKGRTDIPESLPFLFLSRQIICYTSFNQYEEGLKAFQTALPLVKEGMHNWFNIYRVFTLLSFKVKNYQAAYESLLTVKSNKNYKELKGDIKEAWRIIEAYINFLIKVDKIIVEDESSIDMKFRISKFVNDVPKYSKDKMRINIPIIIIQVLFLLQKKEYGKMIDKVESLRAYCYRYLKKDNTFRSNCFIKLLLVIPKGNFNRIAVERKSEQLLSKLKSVPIESVRQGIDVEFIPYEALWEIVLGMLDTKTSKVKLK